MNIRYDMYGAPGDHPQKVMRELGIAFTHSTPQSMLDCWWFWNCCNVPIPLPKFLTELKIDPFAAIGRGLSREDAEEIEGIEQMDSATGMFHEART